MSVSETHTQQKTKLVNLYLQNKSLATVIHQLLMHLEQFY